MQSGGGIGVAVPDDQDLGPTGSGASSSLTPQPPWQSIPKFIPGTTNVQEYTQKLKFLAAMWPSEHLEQLAPRAALLVEGSAFKKVARLDPAKLKVPNQTGIALLVDAIGGSWGSTELEERYEYFEKSIYGTVQRADESHDSYLARMEANFVELISRGTTLEEVQAYILLRQSTLPADDKKKILLEHEGDLKYKPVVKSFRLLGSRFFNEFQSGKHATKTKVYDVNVTESHDLEGSDRSERAFFSNAEDFEGDLDQETVEALAAQEDADALTVCAFENELEEFLQETPEMHDAMTTYLEARNRLLEKRRNRGFWPTKGRGGNKGSKGKSKGKRGRDQLLARIARSHCRKCGQLGHWKAECPMNTNEKTQVNSTASANVAMDEHECLEDEVYSEPESNHQARDVGFDSFSMCSRFSDSMEECYMAMFQVSTDAHQKLHRRMSKFCTHAHKPGDNITGINGVDKHGDKCLPRVASDQNVPMKGFPKTSRPIHRTREVLFKSAMPGEIHPGLAEEQVHLSVNNGSTHAILDTGASRCIIGEKVLNDLKSQLPDAIRAKLKTSPSEIKFRFGNNQSLTSSFRVHFPLKGHDKRIVWLAVEVVPGRTPFLFSKRAFKMLGGVLDTVHDSCHMHRLHSEPIQLVISST